MHRFFIEDSRWAGGPVELGPDESHHAARVARLRPGERVELFTGAGRVAEAEFVCLRRDRAVLQVLPGTERQAPAPAPALTLVQALPKHPAMDGIVQKAVELGVSAVQPLITERVVVRLGAAEAVRRRERWQKISLEAARQCGAAWVPDVRPPAFLTEWLAGAPAFDLVLIGSLQPGARPFRDAAAAWRGAPPSRAALVIGPEGDLSDAETGALLAAGGVPVRFGSTVLRVETAAVAGLALLRYELDAARAARPAP